MREGTLPSTLYMYDRTSFENLNWIFLESYEHLRSEWNVTMKQQCAPHCREAPEDVRRIYQLLSTLLPGTKPNGVSAFVKLCIKLLGTVGFTRFSCTAPQYLHISVIEIASG